MFEDDFENEDMAPEEESFAVDEGDDLEDEGIYDEPSPANSSNDKNGRSKSLSELRQKSGNGSSNDGKKLQDTIAKNKTKNAGANIAKNAAQAATNKDKNNENGEEDENGQNGGSKLEDAAKGAAGDAAKLAASTAMQAAGVPKAIADKASEAIVDSEAGQKIIDETIKKFKEKKKQIILQIVSAALPYVLTFFIVVLVIALLYAQIMVIAEKVDKGLAAASTFAEELLNFTTGNGWNTEEEEFFKTLKEQYNESLKYNEHGFDIPLLASTIHYSKLTDISIYEDDDSPETDTSTSGELGMFDNFLAGEQLKNFYYVANDKLGSIYDFRFGHRKLIGHMFEVKLSFEKTNFSTAMDNWKSFISFFGGTLGESFKNANPFQLFSNIRSIFAYSSDAAGENSDNYFEYTYRNYRYEYEEVMGFFDDNSDQNDANYSSSNVNSDNISTEEKNSGFWIAPKIEIIYNEDYYYNYLVEVYIPGTYFSDGVYEQETVERIAREIFEQKESYYYLLEGTVDEVVDNSCKYNYGTGTDLSPTINGYTIDSNLIDNLMVEVFDSSCETITKCTDDNITDTISLKDYVMGVTYSEIDADIGDNEEWIKANMVAIQSYTFGKNPGTLRKEEDKYYIKIANNNSQQSYCNVKEGCTDRKSNAKSKLAEASIEYLSGLYDMIKYDLLHASGSNFTGSYKSDYAMCVSAGIVGSCMGQNDSEKDAEAGLNYKNILGKYYSQNIGLYNAATNKVATAVRQCYSPGLVAGNYSNILIRQNIPTSKDIYYNVPYVSNSNRGQCVWYVKGRASEIIGTTVTDEELRNQLLGVLKNANGNGNQWYNKTLQSVFGSSTDYTKPKAGSIAVYTWKDSRCLSYWKARGENYCKENYGHALIVEEVNEINQTVTITDGYTNTGSCPNDWNCVNFRSRQNYSISDLDDLGGEYIFIGYIYLLD